MTAVQTAPAAQASPKAFGVWFKDLERWDTGFFKQVSWNWSKEVIKPLSVAIARRNDPVTLKGKTENLPIIEKITFGGVLSIRSEAKRKNYKGRLFWAHSGDLVFSKIRIKQGSISVLPENLEDVAVSAEYPVYKVNKEVAVPAYLLLLVRTKTFMQLLEGKSHGGSSKTRIRPETVEAAMVPLPPLHIQQAIINKWQQAQREIADATARLAGLEALTPQYLLSQLGIPTRDVERILPKAFVLEWKDLERWSVNYLARVSTGASDVYKSHFPVRSLGEVASISYGIQKGPQNRPRDRARPYLRVANVQNGLLDLSEIKYINVSDDAMSAFRLQKHDLLVCEGNSAELVGRPAIWNEEIPNCVHQNHILKARADTSLALPQFILEYMLTPPARSYFRARAKFTTNLASINSNDLRELPLPIPPLVVQQKLVAELEERRAEIALERELLEVKTKEAERSVSSLILGLETL